MGRFAVVKELRRNGYGKILMEKLTEYAREKGYKGIELSAVETAVGFYEKQGFSTVGDYYLETGVPHIYMKKEFTF
jgi:predicted GNAT family N-acyltransferase